MKSPQRIISLTEEPAELIYLLGEENRLVGISAYTVRPKRAKEEKPAVSAFINGNIKKIKDLKPDLVIGFSDIQSELAGKLIKEGLNVLITNQRSISEILDTMVLLGRILGKEREAEGLVISWRDKIKTIQEKSSKFKKKPKVFFQEWDEPIISAIQWVSELIEICGGKEIFYNGENLSLAKDRIVKMDEIIKINPDIIIGSWCGKKMEMDWIKNNLFSTNAYKNNQVFEIDSSIILQPGPALFLEGIDEVFKIVERFS